MKAREINGQRGFTTLELVFSLVIVGILATAVAAKYVNLSWLFSDTAEKTNVQTVSDQFDKARSQQALAGVGSALTGGASTSSYYLDSSISTPSSANCSGDINRAASCYASGASVQNPGSNAYVAGVSPDAGTFEIACPGGSCGSYAGVKTVTAAGSCSSGYSKQGAVCLSDAGFPTLMQIVGAQDSGLPAAPSGWSNNNIPATTLPNTTASGQDAARWYLESSL